MYWGLKTCQKKIRIDFSESPCYYNYRESATDRRLA